MSLNVGKVPSAECLEILAVADSFVHSTSVWQVTKHQMEFFPFPYDWPVKEFFKLTSGFLETVTHSHSVRQMKMLISSYYSSSLSGTKTSEGPEQMADCSKLMHWRDGLQSTK